jgi:acyl carrier protein
MNPLPTETVNAIKQVLINDLQADPATIMNADARMGLLGRGIGLDSVEALQLALGLEHAFDIQIPDSDLTLELFATLGTLTAYVERKLMEKERV